MDTSGATRELRYDNAGRVIAVGDTPLRYDRHGLLLARGTDAVEHDAAGRMIRVGTGKDAWTYAYDGDRLVKLTTDMTSATFEYDALGRLHRLHALGRRLPSDLETVYDYECR